MKRFASLLCNDEADAKIKFSEWFVNEDPLFRADVLQDILQQVQAAYNEAVPLIMNMEKAPEVSPEG